ncbi:hypothetical protein V6N13_088679 [Hibiscus sabdariffa]|uniref:starch synthase n=1 Tax=Hibiscus sabdariffa TaxID=183260 RepID=A0ABR2G100_9ROSI
MFYDAGEGLTLPTKLFLSGIEIKVWFGKVGSLSVYLLESQNGFIWKDCVYGCNNDAERFDFFCHAALEFLHQGRLQPDHYMHYGLSKTQVVFPIYNLEFGSHIIAKAMQYADKGTTLELKHNVLNPTDLISVEPVVLELIMNSKGGRVMEQDWSWYRPVLDHTMRQRNAKSRLSKDADYYHLQAC